MKHLPFVFGLVVAIVLSGASDLFAAPAPKTRTTAHVATKTKGRSVGSPNEGTLEGGVKLEPEPGLRIVPAHQNTGARWGLPELVRMIQRAARKVNKEHSGGTMSVGDLSRPGGGEISGHHSHESGRDVDIGFYMTTNHDKAYLPSRFVAFDEKGKPVGAPGAHFDDARNWALVSALFNDPEAHITQVFVAEHIRARLLAYAEKIHAPIALRNKAATFLIQPRHALPHDDHFHVRISCPSSQKNACVEYATKETHSKTAKKGSHGKGASKHNTTASHKTKVEPKKAHKSTARTTPAVTHTASKSEPHSRPPIAHGRRRGGSAGITPPPLAGVIPDPGDFNTPDEAPLDEGGQIQVTR